MLLLVWICTFACYCLFKKVHVCIQANEYTMLNYLNIYTRYLCILQGVASQTRKKYLPITHVRQANFPRVLGSNDQSWTYIYESKCWIEMKSIGLLENLKFTHFCTFCILTKVEKKLLKNFCSDYNIVNISMSISCRDF